MFKVTLEHEDMKVEITHSKKDRDASWKELLPIMFDALKGMGYSFNEGAALYVDNEEQM